MILGIDTSSALTSAAVLDGAEVRAYAEHDDPRRHGEILAALIDQVLADGGHPPVELIACGVGPGPYTGLRVGIATAGLQVTAHFLLREVRAIEMHALDGRAIAVLPRVLRVEARLNHRGDLGA